MIQVHPTNTNIAPVTTDSRVCLKNLGFSAPPKKFCSLQKQCPRMTESVVNKRFTLSIQISPCNPEIALNPELFSDGLLQKKEEEKILIWWRGVCE